MNPEDFLDVARGLLKPANAGEAALRSAESRAYYAAFGVVATALGAWVRLRGDASDHVLLSQLLRQSHIAGADVLGDKLADLRERRNKADYRVRDPGPTANHAALTCALATAVIGDFRALPYPALEEGVLKYLRLRGEA